MTTQNGVSYKPLDVTYDVIAPENILFRYVIAGPFLRLWAWLWDVTIIFAWLVLSSVGAAFLSMQILRMVDGKWEDVLIALFWTFGIANIFFHMVLECDMRGALFWKNVRKNDLRVENRYDFGGRN